jgi:hypothetical protein
VSAVQPYRTPPPNASAAPEEAADVGIDEDAIVHALVFVVGAIGVATALSDSTQTTAGALGALAMIVALWSFVRERRRALTRQIASTRTLGKNLRSRSKSSRSPV